METLEQVEVEIEEIQNDKAKLEKARDKFVRQGQISESDVPIGYLHSFRKGVLDILDECIKLCEFLEEERETDRKIITETAVYKNK